VTAKRADNEQETFPTPATPRERAITLNEHVCFIDPSPAVVSRQASKEPTSCWKHVGTPSTEEPLTRDAAGYIVSFAYVCPRSQHPGKQRCNSEYGIGSPDPK